MKTREGKYGLGHGVKVTRHQAAAGDPGALLTVEVLAETSLLEDRVSRKRTEVVLHSVWGQEEGERERSQERAGTGEES